MAILSRLCPIGIPPGGNAVFPSFSLVSLDPCKRRVLALVCARCLFAWRLPTIQNLEPLTHVLVRNRVNQRIQVRGKCVLVSLSRVRLFATPWTVARQAPLPGIF